MTETPSDIPNILENLGISSGDFPNLSSPSKEQQKFLELITDPKGQVSTVEMFDGVILKKPVKVARNRAIILPRMSFRRCVFLSSCDFSGANFQTTVRFENCVFVGEASFESVEFAGVGFRGNRFMSKASFFRAKFGINIDATKLTPFGPGFVSFESTRFEDAVNFDSSVFLNGASFEKAQFAQASFADIQIKGIANFRNTTHKGSLHFTRSEINGEAHFEDSKFKDTADFSSCVFKEGTHFKDTTFEKDISFESTAFHGLTTFSLTSFGGNANFHASHLHGATTFLHAKWERLPNFINAVFSSSLDMSSFTSLPIQRRIAEDTRADKLAACKVRKLRDLAKQNQDLWLELDFFAWELELSELAKQRNRSPFLFIYKFLSDYGRSIKRPLVCFVLTLAVSALLNISFGPSRPFRFTEGELGVVKGNCEGLRARRCLSWTESIELALSNMTPFLAPSEQVREKVWPKKYRGSALYLVGWISSLVSLVSLFFLLLGLRNRFRMK